MRKLIHWIKKDFRLFVTLKYYRTLAFKHLLGWMSDETFIRLQYLVMTKTRLNLKEPKTYNEKIQYIKLNYRPALMSQVVDKIKVRDYVRKKIGDTYFVETLGYFDHVEEIDFSSLPDTFVIKLNNGSGMNYICKQKDSIAIKEIRFAFKKWLKTDYFYLGREWAYKHVSNKIIVERYLETGKNELMDVKFYANKGKVAFIKIDVEGDHEKRYVLTPDWQFIPAKIGSIKTSDDELEKFEAFDEMLELAQVLAEDFLHVRVDFYYANEKIYFGELTFYQSGGYRTIEPASFNLSLARLIDLDKPAIEGYMN